MLILNFIKILSKTKKIINNTYITNEDIIEPKYTFLNFNLIGGENLLINIITVKIKNISIIN